MSLKVISYYVCSYFTTNAHLHVECFEKQAKYMQIVEENMQNRFSK